MQLFRNHLCNILKILYHAISYSNDINSVIR